MADPHHRFDTILSKLKENDYKITHQRMAIARILAHSDGHPSIEQIYEQLKPNFPTMSLATVYRNVMIIKSLGEVLELGFPDGSNRYDGNRPHPHPHLICLGCRKIIDPNLESLREMAAEVAAETDFEIISHRLDFFGYCSECRRARR